MFRPGDRVTHPINGDGTVLSIAGGRAEVRFDEVRKKEGDPIRNVDTPYCGSEDTVMVRATWHITSELELLK